MKGGRVEQPGGRRAFGCASAESLLRREEDLDVTRTRDWLTHWASFNPFLRLDTAPDLDEG